MLSCWLSADTVDNTFLTGMYVICWQGAVFRWMQRPCIYGYKGLVPRSETEPLAGIDLGTDKPHNYAKVIKELNQYCGPADAIQHVDRKSLNKETDMPNQIAFVAKLFDKMRNPKAKD